MTYFIAYTPLHVLIIQEIIKKEKISNFILFYFFDVDSKKNRSYFTKLQIDAQKAFYLKKKISFSLIFILTKLKINHIFNSNSNVYCGNLKTFYSRIVIYFLKLKINTFDDGLGNIVKDGYLFDKSEKSYSKIFFKIFKPKLIYRNITKYILKHYSIYNQPNIYPNVEVLNLTFNTLKNRSEITSNSANVFIGTLYSESGFMTLDNEYSFLNKTIEKFKIEFFIPHPRCKKKDLAKVKKIISEKIAEEIILELLSEYSEINVFGSYSTTLVNLSNVKGLNIYNVKNDYFDNMNGIKELFEDFNITTVKL